MKNIEVWISEAADALDQYKRKHDTACVLSLYDGKVVVTPYNKCPSTEKDVFKISHADLVSGLTTANWNKLGEAFCEKARELNL